MPKADKSWLILLLKMPKADEKPAKPASEMCRQATKKYTLLKRKKGRYISFISMHKTDLCKKLKLIIILIKKTG